jgi:hypothetical protein
VPASAAPTAAPGSSPETEEVPAAAEESPAALPPADLSAPAASEVVEPMVEPLIPGPALQQAAQGAASQEQAGPVYSSEIAAPASTEVQPLMEALTNVLDTSASAAASAVAGLLGTVGQWVSDAASSGEDGSSSSSGGLTTPEPLAPVSPAPLGGNTYALSSGLGQVSAGGAGATLLLGVLVLASIPLLRRDLRMYLVSCEVAKPSSALLSPLERPG